MSSEFVTASLPKTIVSNSSPYRIYSYFVLEYKLVISKKMELSQNGKTFQHHCAEKSLTGQWLWEATLFSILLSKKKALLYRK